VIFTQGSRRRNKERGMRMTSHGDIHILSLKTKNEEIKLTNKINKQKVTFNARGTKFQITKDALENISSTSRLGILKDFEKMDTEKILSYCDDFDPVAVEFFFNRNPNVLSLILDHALTGELHLCTHLCEVYLRNEFVYWLVENDQINPCCSNNFEENYENKIEIMNFDSTLYEKLKTRQNEKQTFKTKLWYTLNNPVHSALAMVRRRFFIEKVNISD
jgi:hypothetical protein